MSERVEKPWGWYEVIKELPGATVKILCVNPGQRLSNQYHNKRSEYLVAFSGHGGVEIDGEVHVLRSGLAVHIPVRAEHRIYCSSNSDGPLMITEVWVGKSLEEGDIVRLQDDYGRIKPNNS